MCYAIVPICGNLVKLYSYAGLRTWCCRGITAGFTLALHTPFVVATFRAIICPLFGSYVAGSFVWHPALHRLTDRLIT